MHYKNGRVAQNGDKVVLIPGAYGAPMIGILYDATAGNDYCNGKLAAIRPNDPCPNLSECLHFDDVKAALGDIEAVVDSSASDERQAGLTALAEDLNALGVEL